MRLGLPVVVAASLLLAAQAPAEADRPETTGGVEEPTGVMRLAPPPAPNPP